MKMGNTLYLFVRGTANKIYLNTFNGSSWSAWSVVSGNGLTPSTPATARLEHKHDDVAGREETKYI